MMTSSLVFSFMRRIALNARVVAVSAISVGSRSMLEAP